MLSMFSLEPTTSSNNGVHRTLWSRSKSQQNGANVEFKKIRGSGAQYSGRRRIQSQNPMRDFAVKTNAK